MAMTQRPTGAIARRGGALGIALAAIALLVAPILLGAPAALLAQDSELRPIGKPEVSPATPEEGVDPAKPAEEPDDPLDAASEEPGDLTGGLEALDEITRLTREIRENMKKIEELLNRKETGAATQGAQSRTIEQIDSLIELVESACSSSSSGGSKSSGGQPSSQQEKDQAQSRKKQDQVSSQQRPASEQRRESASREPKDSPAQSRNDQTSVGELPPDDEGDLQDRTGRGRWGRLPRTEIEKMYDNGRRQLPEKYRILLEDYFRRLPTDGE